MPRSGTPNRFVALGLVLALAFSGCVRYRPNTSNRASFMERAQTQTLGDLTATVAVLSDKESKKVFGAPLAKKGVQPVWVDIRNQSTVPYVFIPRNMDPNYYSADEAAYMAHFKQTKKIFEAGLLGILCFPALALIPFDFFAVRHANGKMDATFTEEAMRSNIIMPDSREAGFVFTSVDQGTKHVKVDLLSSAGQKTFDFVVTVPGMKADYTTKDLENRYPEEKITDCTAADIPKLLAQLPCCTTNKKGTRNGDPFNLVLIGDLEDIITILTSTGWDETEALTFKTGLAMARDFFTGRENRYSPISPLFHNGHSQDIAFQKARNNINQRLHLRLWYTSVRYGGKPVWIGAISRDIGVKFTFKVWYLTTHKIDPNLDDARDYILADLLQIEKVSKFGFIEGASAAKPAGPRKNLTGDPYFTDNKLLVIGLSVNDTAPAAFPWNNLFPKNPPSK